MIHRRFRITRGVALLCLIAAGSVFAHAEPVVQVDPAAARRDDLLAELGLLRPLAASLRAQIQASQGERRKELADQLGALYAKMMGSNPTADERRSLEIRCRELLAQVPESATPALRLTLATAQYLPIEDLAERSDLLLATPEETVEAKRVLADVTPVFERLAKELGNRVRTLEDKKDRGNSSDEDLAKLRTQLDEQRELRSKAEFRAAWACYYQSLLTGERQGAARAMEHFGVMLNAVPGRPASIDRAPLDLLKYDHIAKAVLGCSLASSRLGNHVEAIRWMSELEQSTELSKDVASQLLRRNLSVLAADDRWSDIDFAVVKARRGDNGGVQPLALADARTLAVICLSSLRRPDFREGLKPTAQKMAQIAMADLVSRGEVGHVMSLVRTFGTAIIGTDGFINNYVRALSAFDDARDLHKSKEPDLVNMPTRVDEVKNAYRQVAGLFRGCLEASDVAKFPALRIQAMICLGLTEHYSGLLDAAATTLEQAFALPGPEPDRRNALQYAIVSLSLAVKGGAANLESRKERLETLFIQSFPNTREANAMVLQRTSGGKALNAADIDALLKVPKEDPLYHASRSVAADGLYKAWKQPTAQTSREFAAVRYTDIAIELLRVEFAEASGSEDATARRTADVAVNRARRIAEVALSTNAPDASMASEVLGMIDALAKFHGVNLSKLEDELCYRRFQVAIARRDGASSDRELSKLRELGGPFVNAAERFMYRRALDEWNADHADADAAIRLVSSGSRVLLQAEYGASGLAAVRDAVAGAAASLWKQRGDLTMRDLALRLDREQLEKGFKTLSSLRRLGMLFEETGDPKAAAEAWLAVLTAVEEESNAWYEARHESIRLIAKYDADAAASAFAQFKALHPALGPQPWDAKFTVLEQVIRSSGHLKREGAK